jgi:hypothetical protein
LSHSQKSLLRYVLLVVVLQAIDKLDVGNHSQGLLPILFRISKEEENATDCRLNYFRRLLIVPQLSDVVFIQRGNCFLSLFECWLTLSELYVILFFKCLNLIRLILNISRFFFDYGFFLESDLLVRANFLRFFSSLDIFLI